MAKIRIAAPEDYPAYYRIKCGRSDIYWNGFEKAPDMEGLRKSFLSRLANTPEQIGSKVIYMIEGEDGVACGYIMVTYNAGDAELGFSILEEYQGRGYGTLAVREILEECGRSTVFARVRPDNLPSQRCFEKNGFTFTCRETEEKYYPLDGSFHCYNRFQRNI